MALCLHSWLRAPVLRPASTRPPALHRRPGLSFSTRQQGVWRAKAGEERSDVAEEGEKREESKTNLPRRGFGSPQALGKDKKQPSSSKSPSSPSGSVRRAPPSVPLLASQESDESVLKIESRFVTFLVILFAFIISQGLTLAVAGFLPEEYDEVVFKFIYPAFTPTVGIFIALAAGYGLWKSSR